MTTNILSGIVVLVNRTDVRIFVLEGRIMKKMSRREMRIRKEKAKRTRRRKVTARITFLLSIFMLIAVMGINIINTAFAKDTTEGYTVIVSPGDTLWDIAIDNNTGNKDIRKVVDSIISANDLKGSNICVGDEIIIPFI